MKILLSILLLCLLNGSCKSGAEKSSVVKSIQNPKMIQGAWHLYDSENNTTIGNGPLFELGLAGKFVDSAEILCHHSKFRSGDLIELIRRHSSSNSGEQKLKNRPAYTYEGDDSKIRIFNSIESDEDFVITINFLDMKRMAKLKNSKSAQIYYLYVDMKHPRSFMGSMTVTGENTQISRMPVVLIRQP